MGNFTGCCKGQPLCAAYANAPTEYSTTNEETLTVYVECCAPGVCRVGSPCQRSKGDAAWSSDNEFFRSYDIGEIIGSGTFGQVRECVAADGEDPTTYAVKLVDKEHTILTKSSAYLRAKDEVVILQRIRHPYIIALHEFFEDDRFLYVVMEKINGGELFKRLAEDMSLVFESDIACLLSQILSAIEYLHALGIVHRDVKAENILLVDGSPERRELNIAESGGALGAIKLIDFGFACFVHTASYCGFFSAPEDETPLTFLCGSPPYLAPEILEGHYGKKVDVWAAAVVLYLILFAQYPYFDVTDPDETNRLILLSDPPPFYVAIDRDWKPSMLARKFLMLLLQKDVNKRPDATGALMHPWIQNNGCEEDEAVSPEVPVDVRRQLPKLANRTPPSAERECSRTRALEERTPERSSGRHRRRRPASPDKTPEKTPDCRSKGGDSGWNSETGSPLSPYSMMSTKTASSYAPKRFVSLGTISQLTIEEEEDMHVTGNVNPCQPRCC